ncbi:MAG TPA: prepilin-type N-terminal cleavage/methylation domain-containing protein [Longimicrobiaceae bacterium]
MIPVRRDESGMTLLELMVAVVLTALVVLPAIAFLRQQEAAFSFGTGRMAVLQNHRFVTDALERDLRTVGSGVPATQPFLVYAGTDVVAFNADYAARDPGDVFAIYVDTAAPPASVQALGRSRRFRLPQTSFLYPDTSYFQRGINSPAETILFFFAPDSTTARTDDFVLFRQVNDLPPGVVGRDLLATPGKPFFEYHQLIESDTAAGRVETVASSWLPLRHSAKMHRSAADTGVAARIDRVRAVRVSFTATNGDTGSRAQSRDVSRLIRLPNAGLATLQTCGEAPQLASALSAAPVTLSSGERVVELAWTQGADENGGEKDVVRYVIWRKTQPGADWGDPYLSIPAGRSSYSYQDGDVAPGTTYYYAVAAQDCTPSISSLSSTGAVTP